MGAELHGSDTSQIPELCALSAPRRALPLGGKPMAPPPSEHDPEKDTPASQPLFDTPHKMGAIPE